jgi:hypothetical protein
VAASSAAAVVISRAAEFTGRAVDRGWLTAFRQEMNRLTALAGRLLPPGPQRLALPAPVSPAT